MSAIRAIAYVRQSAAKPGEMEDTSLSFDVQEERIRRWCGERGWPVVEVVRDYDLSGEDPDRPGIQQLLAAAGRGDADTIVVYKMSRFSRDSHFQEEVYRKLRARKVSVVSVTETGIDKSLNRMILGAVNQHYQEELRDWLLDVHESRARRGLHHGKAPLGYRPVKEGQRTVRYRHDEDEAALVRRVYRLRASGMGVDRIADEVNRSGFRTAKGGLYDYVGIKYLLTNPVYAGLRRRKGEIIGAMDQAHMPPIIDRLLWDQVQRTFRPGERQGRKVERSSWLEGLVRHACGRSMWLTFRAGQPRFACPLRQKATAASRRACPHAASSRIAAYALEHAARMCLAADLSSRFQTANEVIDARGRVLGESSVINERELLARQREKVRFKMAKSEEFVYEGLRDNAWLRERTIEHLEELRQIDERIASLAAIPDAAAIAPYVDALNSVADAVPLMSDDALRDLLSAVGHLRIADGIAQVVYVAPYTLVIPNPARVRFAFKGNHRDAWTFELVS